MLLYPNGSTLMCYIDSKLIFTTWWASSATGSSSVPLKEVSTHVLWLRHNQRPSLTPSLYRRTTWTCTTTQVDYKWATWTYTNSPPQPMTGIHGNTTTPTNSTHLYTSGLQVGIPTTSLCTPLNPSMFSSITFMPKKCGLQNKKKILFMLHITLQSLQWAQISLSSPQHTLSGHVPAQKGLKRG